jgi:acetylornithine deacetylase
VLDARLLEGVTRAIVCEPTSCRAGARHRGVLALEARLEGRGGHSSNADNMPAPIADLARLAVAFYDWGVARKSDGPPGFTGMCMNVASLDGGIAFNVVPNRARLCMSVRPPPGADVGAVRRELEQLARGVVPQAKLSATLENPSFESRDPSALAALLGETALVDLPYWTEAALLSAAGIDAVVFGPGDIVHAHSADEHVTLQQLDEARARFVTLFEGAG